MQARREAQEIESMPENMPEGWARCSDGHPVLAAGESSLPKTPWILPAQQSVAYTNQARNFSRNSFSLYRCLRAEMEGSPGTCIPE